MTKREAIENQERLAQRYNLGWWYGTMCEKCCDVYPKLMREGSPSKELCYYECEVCGKRTEGFLMPWMATAAWNDHEYKTNAVQLNLLGVEP